LNPVNQNQTTNMKKLTVFAVAGIMALTACGPSAEETAKKEQILKDSIAKLEMESKAKATQDSIAKVEEEAKAKAAEMEKMKQDSIAKAEEEAKAKKGAKPKPTMKEQKKEEAKKATQGRG
jgi:hypothetical protein